MIAAFFRAGSIILLLAGAARAADGVKAIETDGVGTLTMCRDWVVYDSCNVYNHVAVPKRIAVGDTVPLSFGSDNKQYAFPVARVIKNGIVCTVLSQADGDPEKMDKFEVPSCLDVSASH